MERIRSYLQVQLSPHYIPQKANSDVAIKFRYMLPENGYLDVDLLLSPYWSSEADFLHTLGSGVIKNRQRYKIIIRSGMGLETVQNHHLCVLMLLHGASFLSTTFTTTIT